MPGFTLLSKQVEKMLLNLGDMIMNIEEFMNEENHMCNLGENLFNEIFAKGAIYDLPDNEFSKRIVYWLSQYLVGNVREPLESISKLDIFDQFYIYETWFALIKCPEEFKRLSKRIIQYHIGLKTLL